MHTIPAAGAALALLVALTGCAVAEAQDPVEPAADEVAEQEPVSVDEDCLIGRWSLDVEDYRGQAEAYLKSPDDPPRGLRRLRDPDPELRGGRRRERRRTVDG